MSKNSNYHIEILLDALKKALANSYLLIDKTSNDIQRFQCYSRFYSGVSLKAYSIFCYLNNTYSKKSLALKAFNEIYSEVFIDSTQNFDDLNEYLEIDNKFSGATNDENFLLFTISSFPEFFKCCNKNRIKHIINTYIPKVKKIMKMDEKYNVLFYQPCYNKQHTQRLLFYFLIENS